MDILAGFMEAVREAVEQSAPKVPLEEVDVSGERLGLPQYSNEQILEDKCLYLKISAAAQRRGVLVSCPRSIECGFWMKRKLRGDLIITTSTGDEKIYVEIKVVRVTAKGEVSSAAISDIRNAVLQTVEYANGYDAHCALLVVIDSAMSCEMGKAERLMVKKCSELMTGEKGLLIAQVFKERLNKVEGSSAETPSGDDCGAKWGWKFLY